MLSRRNIRTKLLETLYSATIDGDKSNQEIRQDYLRSVYDAYELLLFVLQSLVKIASFATEDKTSRQKKYLPDEEDRNFEDWLAQNPLVQALAAATPKPSSTHPMIVVPDEDVLRKVYRDFAKTENYKQYSSLENPSDSDHQNIALDLLKFMLKSEVFEDYLRDIFLNYDTDKSHIKGTGKKVLKNITNSPDYVRESRPDNETVEEFGITLLKDYIAHYPEYSKMIQQQLENWDLDRIALIDLICMQMGISELLSFETIPVKVTINEYLELVKNYSTEKSSDFVNGVLDKILKDLVAGGKLNKTGRGLVD